MNNAVSQSKIHGLEGSHRAVFLDRDGVLIRDVDWLTSAGQIDLLDGVPAALKRLKAQGFLLVMATNQSVVARGLITIPQLNAIHKALQSRLIEQGGVALDAIYYCPFHPEATLPEFRRVSPLRKPRPGMLIQAARELDIDLPRSFMVGDRISDVIAGRDAGCRTLLLRTGKQSDPPISGVPEDRLGTLADWTGSSLLKAAQWLETQ